MHDMPRQETKDYTNRAEYLAAAPEKLGTVTLDEDLFARDANGKVICQPGLVLAKPSATDLWGPYASDADDGREVATDNVLILHDYVVLDDGETAKDAEVAVLLRGIAKGDKVILEDGTEASAAIKAALRSAISDVIFEVGTAGDPA